MTKDRRLMTDGRRQRAEFGIKKAEAESIAYGVKDKDSVD